MLLSIQKILRMVDKFPFFYIHVDKVKNQIERNGIKLEKIQKVILVNIFL